ncbi:FAD:protein FMN transferase [Pasteurella atlantica]|uniref:FAD:protein FMN transferase n=1 Tax=Pasteurellaceae TaxID=712 RepID=UPI00274CAFA5|nr:FAD:protein FMN transferase [Pasteurella atlantica]MDP8099342.1 FAD:protein FMN transferase [Pasteurella atlantica]MDP8107301.1 FAD:protein FMN transferase [Pasteurella atlantica]MDP8116992.1 FAD:protein FMN transferase [Pasteurella atlantica]
MNKLKLFGALALALFLLSGCNQESEQISLEGKTMGTTYHIKYIDEHTKELLKPAEIKKEIDHLLVGVNNAMSTYQKDSEISRFNQSIEINKPFVISKDFATVVKSAFELNKITQGALDITVGPLVNLWGFGPDKRLNQAPTEQQITEKSQAVGINKIRLLSENNQFSLVKTHSKVYIDTSSIAKGFGVDKLAQYLEQLGIENYLVEIGGELRAKGKNIHKDDWQIAIEKPTLVQGQEIQILVPISNLGIATSGSYRNYFEDDEGNRLSHIIDPKQLKPISHNLASITVLANTSMKADGLATGLFVLGTDKALEIAEREHLAIFLIIKTDNGYETKMSSEFKKLTHL